MTGAAQTAGSTWSARSDIRVSTVGCATVTQTHDVDANRIIEITRAGGTAVRPKVEAIRKTFRSELAKHGDYKLAKKAIDSAKKQLPAVTWSGTFTKRASGKLVNHSGLLCADLDNLGSRLKDVREKLSHSPHVWAMFTSPSGDGLKVVFRVPADSSRHSGSFRAVEQHVKGLTGVQIDEACKDLARLCFLSYDPEVFHNPGAVEIEPLPEPEKTRAVNGASVDLSARQRIAGEMLGSIDWESETSGVTTCPGKHLHTSSDGVRDCMVDLDQAPTVHCFHNSCRGVLDGVNYEVRSRIGQAERANEKQFVGNGGDHPETEAPATTTKPTIDDAAFYGLAGEIARTIDPYSESDPVAILVNVLVGFGNVVGSSPHFLVEKTEHHLNLFVAEVGKTAKGRKGLAWSTPRYMLSRVDPEYGNRRIQGGMSSGEGLISAVRDRRDEKRPLKEGGRVVDYETVMVDEGVDDKRLLCVEQEFAQVLKVMGREGNILSEIVRNAWDGSRLAPMTKHSPIQATGAHIAIIAHITQGELVRHLNDTEQANGFANRFIWLYLERSKEIPDPVGVPDEVLEPFIDRLRSAVDFARKTTLMRRDEGAAIAWRDVYHELSDEKSGLVGSILGRAEAQVMRLACVYALLDESPLVRVEHLEPALALWDYAEKCARFIFGDVSGDPVVDRIMGALKQGPQSESDIANLFGRHGYEKVDRALAFIHKDGLATPEIEETGGRPKTIWRLCAPAQKAQDAQKAVTTRVIVLNALIAQQQE